MYFVMYVDVHTNMCVVAANERERKPKNKAKLKKLNKS